MDDVPLNKSPSQKPDLLHGSLEVSIYEARELPNMDMVKKIVRQCVLFLETCTLRILMRKRNHHHEIITSDPYVSIQVAGATVAQTRIIRNSQNPHWDQDFHVDLAHFASNVEFAVMDNDVFRADLIGTVLIPVQKVLSGDKIEGWFPVLNSSGEPPKPDSALKLSIQFRPAEAEAEALCKDGGGVPNTYFPLRKGGMVSVYQDAHVVDGLLPKIPLDGGKVFEHGKCWEDICHAILEAHHLVYITGWSIYHKVKLVRETTRPFPEGGDLNLGDLLKFKSQEGVRVLLLVWDDKTSQHNMLLKTEGVMKTHDEETKKFFKHSSVQCELASRYASSGLSWVEQMVVGIIHTHHQKNVIVDSQAHGDYRKITAFIGGLDLCDGRYDTPEHRLFKDLETVYKEDYHNPTFTQSVFELKLHPWVRNLLGPFKFQKRRRATSRGSTTPRGTDAGPVWAHAGLTQSQKGQRKRDAAFMQKDRIAEEVPKQSGEVDAEAPRDRRDNAGLTQGLPKDNIEITGDLPVLLSDQPETVG
eukprot:PITA_24040